MKKQNFTMKKVYTLFLILFFLGVSPIMNAQEWERLADIPEGLNFSAVTVLNNHIHLIGGGGDAGASNSHYSYDPDSDEWTTLASAPYLAQMPASAVAEGKLHYFGGGYPNSGSPLDDHYIYDPETDSWSQAASLTAPRAIHYGASINNTVYTAAGQGVTTLFQAYDPITDNWIDKASLPDNFFMYSARCASNGKYYRFCGGGYSAPKNYAHVYDPGSDEWSALPNFPEAVHGMEGSAVGDSIYLTGGSVDDWVNNTVWIFNTISQTYTEGPAMPIERYYHNTVTINDCIYVVGGYHPIVPDSTKRSLIRYCPYNNTVGIQENNTWEQVRFRVNPSCINIDLPNEFVGNNVNVDVYDILGRNVYSSCISHPQGISHTFSTKGLEKSICIIRLSTEEEQYVKKIYLQQ